MNGSTDFLSKTTASISSAHACAGNSHHRGYFPYRSARCRTRIILLLLSDSVGPFFFNYIQRARNASFFYIFTLINVNDSNLHSNSRKCGYAPCVFLLRAGCAGLFGGVYVLDYFCRCACRDMAEYQEERCVLLYLGSNKCIVGVYRLRARDTGTRRVTACILLYVDLRN